MPPPCRDSFSPRSLLPRPPELDGRAGPCSGIVRSDGIGSRSSASRIRVGDLILQSSRRARFHLCLDHFARQHPNGFAAFSTNNDSISPVRCRRVESDRPSSDAEIVEAVVALLVERPIPTQGVRLQRFSRRLIAWFIALLLCVDVIGRVALDHDLRDDGRVTFVIEFFRAELSLDPDLRQSIAKWT